jgi:hypothetical protein
MEEVTSTTILHDMFLQMSSLIAGAEEVMKELDEAMPNLTGLQFVVIHYYKNFVSPRNFQGYALVMLTIVPQNTNDIIREIIKQAADDNLGKIFLIAARNDDSNEKLKILKNESDRLVQARVKILRSL